MNPAPHPLPPHYRPAPVVLADKWTIVAGEWVQVPHFLAKQPDGWTEVPVRVVIEQTKVMTK